MRYVAVTGVGRPGPEIDRLAEEAGRLLAGRGCVVVTGAGQGRNLAVALTGDAMIAIGVGWGTLSEIGHARKAGRPVVTLAGWELDGVARAATPAEAVDMAIAALGGDPVE